MTPLQPRCIIVLSTGRSGSSAVAGVLHHLGVFMTKRENTAGFNHKNHPGGHWEDLRWHRHGMKIIAASPSKVVHPTVADVEKFQTLIDERKKHRIWGIKTPTFALLLEPLMKAEIFPDDVRVVAVHRNLVSTSLSRQEKDRPSMTRQQAYTKQIAWYLSMLRAIQYVQSVGVPVHHIGFELMANAPYTYTNNLLKFINAGLPSTDKLRPDVDAAARFINSDHVRF